VVGIFGGREIGAGQLVLFTQLFGPCPPRLRDTHHGVLRKETRVPVKRHISASHALRASLVHMVLLLLAITVAPASAHGITTTFTQRVGGVAASEITSIAITSTSDVADGDTTSFAALTDQPGADGVITLREALLASNTMAAAALTIAFNIPTTDPGYTSATGTWTIALESQALPAIGHGNVTLDGTTQLGSSSRPQIVLDGYNVYEAPGLSNGITITSAGNIVRGLTLMNFYDDALLLDGPGAAFNQIAGNYIGTNARGGPPGQTSYFGVEIRNGAHDNTIGGASSSARNLISGNANSGVLIQGATSTNNTIANNWIGTDATGKAFLKNDFAGIMISAGATNNTIGGAGSGNLISGNNIGIYVDGGMATVIAGNLIGLAADGKTPLSNTDGGIFVVNGAHDTLIGGASAALRNIISGNGSSGSSSGQGIYVANATTSNTTIIGNYVGVDASGQLPAGNFRQGILIGIGAQNNWIGGTAPGEGNVIAYNGLGGVRIDSPNNHVAGNMIGIGANGTTQLGNQSNGVRIGGDNNTIGPNNLIAYNQHSGILLLGGNTTVLSNTIEANGRSGMCITAPNTTIDRNLIEGNGTGDGPWAECNIQGGIVITDTNNTLVTSNSIFANIDTGITVYGGISNRILSNSISDNLAAGIRLLRGGNDEVLPPQISSVQTTNINGNSCPSCRVEVFTDAKDEGRYFVGATIASSSGAFSVAVPPGELHGPHVTATHTDTQGNTSAFAPAVTIPAPTEETPTPTPQLPPKPSGSPPLIFLPMVAH